MNKKLVLASQSPRRRELIALLELPFQVVPAMGEEIFDENLNIEENLIKVAASKTAEVFKMFPETTVIGGDTVVVFNNETLQKPIDEEDAQSMLEKLSGNIHEVWTAVSMKSSQHKEDFIVKATVKFYEMTSEEITKYIASGEPMDKAGAYNIDGYGALFIEEVVGDYFAVMGLPIASVYQKLKSYTW